MDRQAWIVFWVVVAVGFLPAIWVGRSLADRVPQPLPTITPTVAPSGMGEFGRAHVWTPPVRSPWPTWSPRLDVSIKTTSPPTPTLLPGSPTSGSKPPTNPAPSSAPATSQPATVSPSP